MPRSAPEACGGMTRRSASNGRRRSASSSSAIRGIPISPDENRSTRVNIRELQSRLDPAGVGQQMHRLIAELYPICRSITGDGLRETLRRIQQHIPLTLQEVPSGTQVFDWTVPREWNIRDAYVKNAKGDRVVDFQESNLCIVNYSVPIKARM